MNPHPRACVLAAMLALASAAAQAETIVGVLTLSGTIESALSLTVENAGGTTAGLGTGAATALLGSISKFGNAPTGFGKVPMGSNWFLASDVNVKVEKSNLVSGNFSLSVQLASAPPSGVRWMVRNMTLSDAYPLTVMPTGVYDVGENYPWNIVVEDSADAGAIDNTLVFTATGN